MQPSPPPGAPRPASHPWPPPQPEYRPPERYGPPQSAAGPPAAGPPPPSRAPQLEPRPEPQPEPRERGARVEWVRRWWRDHPGRLVVLVVVVILLAVAGWGAAVNLIPHGPASEGGPGPLGLIAGVRPAAGTGTARVLRVIAPSYAGAELATCKLPSGGPEPGTYRLAEVIGPADYDAALGGVGGDWVVTTGRTSDGAAVVTAYTPSQRVTCTVAPGLVKLLPDRTQTWALTTQGSGQATP
jgi:hypothetical protein